MFTERKKGERGEKVPGEDEGVTNDWKGAQPSGGGGKRPMQSDPRRAERGGGRNRSPGPEKFHSSNRVQGGQRRKARGGHPLKKKTRERNIDVQQTA